MHWFSRLLHQLRPLLQPRTRRIMLFGSGVFGLAGVIRRKLSL
jgi:hypothetical protein